LGEGTDSSRVVSQGYLADLDERKTQLVCGRLERRLGRLSTAGADHGGRHLRGDRERPSLARRQDKHEFDVPRVHATDYHDSGAAWQSLKPGNRWSGLPSFGPNPRSVHPGIPSLIGAQSWVTTSSTGTAYHRPECGIAGSTFTRQKPYLCDRVSSSPEARSGLGGPGWVTTSSCGAAGPNPRE
jgi:hypothetical protein